jgi:hypothetical protein
MRVRLSFFLIVSFGIVSLAACSQATRSPASSTGTVVKPGNVASLPNDEPPIQPDGKGGFVPPQAAQQSAIVYRGTSN